MKVINKEIIKGPMPCLRQFLTNENPLKMMKNAFYFMLKALFVLGIIAFLSWLFGYAEKRLDMKTTVNFKTRDVTDWTTDNYNTHITQYLKKKMQSGNEIWSVNKIQREKYFVFKYHAENEKERLVPDLLLFCKKALFKVRASGLH